jgi:hypothetical protein
MQEAQKRKTSDEKSGDPKMQGAQKERPPMKKKSTPKHKGLKKKARVTLLVQTTKSHEGDPSN